LGFNGLIAADYGSITHAKFRYRVSENHKYAAIQALKAGLDVEQSGNQCYQYLVEAVESGEIEEAYIDISVRRLLESKFTLGLFENPYEDGDFFYEINKAENAELSQEIAEDSGRRRIEHRI
jgi:beta-glucosidase